MPVGVPAPARDDPVTLAGRRRRWLVVKCQSPPVVGANQGVETRHQHGLDFLIGRVPRQQDRLRGKVNQGCKPGAVETSCAGATREDAPREPRDTVGPNRQAPRDRQPVGKSCRGRSERLIRRYPRPVTKGGNLECRMHVVPVPMREDDWRRWALLGILKRVATCLRQRVAIKGERCSDVEVQQALINRRRQRHEAGLPDITHTDGLGLTDAAEDRHRIRTASTSQGRDAACQCDRRWKLARRRCGCPNRPWP